MSQKPERAIFSGWIIRRGISVAPVRGPFEVEVFEHGKKHGMPSFRSVNHRHNLPLPDAPCVMEIWIPIKGYSFYDVSNLGRVRSWRIERDHRGRRAPEPTIKTPSPSKKSPHYLFTNIKSDKGKYRSSMVHLLVIEAFKGPAPEGKEAAHQNSNAHDNRVENLEYMTHLENMMQMPGWLSPESIVEIRKMADDGVPYRFICERFKRGRASISRIINGVTHKHIAGARKMSKDCLRERFSRGGKIAAQILHGDRRELKNGS